MKRIVISGAPGTGKSTLLSLLKEAGYSTFEEVARATIKRELSLNPNTELVPWNNNAAFSKLVISQQLNDYHSNEADLAFFDRGLPDVFAYFRFHEEEHLLDQHQNILDDHPYFSTVFICPPEESIYVQDENRKESFEDAKRIHRLIQNEYLNLGYRICEIPFLSPHERLNFILQKLQLK